MLQLNTLFFIFHVGVEDDQIEQDFNEEAGPTMHQRHRLTPIQCFLLFFTDAVWEFLVRKTNEYAQVKRNKHMARRSRYHSWQPVTILEMKAFVGVILNMGIIQLQRAEDYWLTNVVSCIPFFRSVFSRDRFFQIFGMLHVGEIGTCQQKQAKIQPFLDILLPIVQQNFIPGRQVSIDELVIAFKGRVSFRQYLKGKPNPWGIKAYVMADSNTGYMHNIRIYYCKNTDLIENNNFTHTVKVVLTLVEHLHNKGYDLYTDRFYTSPKLAEELDKVGITLTGTLMSNKCGLPSGLKGKQKKACGSFESKRCKKMMVFSWTDKRTITFLSTKYNKKMEEVTSR